jgi:hypothetical protein
MEFESSSSLQILRTTLSCVLCVSINNSHARESTDGSNLAQCGVISPTRLSKVEINCGIIFDDYKAYVFGHMEELSIHLWGDE